MSQLKKEDIYKGINKSNVYGNHKNKYKNYTNPKIDSNKSKAKTTTDKIDSYEVALNKYRAETANQRGFKEGDSGFIGAKPVWWDKTKFNQNRTGFRYDSGASRGGQFYKFKGKSKKMVLGVAGSGERSIVNPNGEPNPFRIKLSDGVVKGLLK